MATTTASAIEAPAVQERGGHWSLGQWRLRSKMILILLLVSQIPLIAVAAFTIYMARGALLHQASINMLGVGSEVARELDHQLLGWQEDIVTVSQLPEVVAYAMSPSDAWGQIALASLKAEASRKNYGSIAVVNREGKIILSSAPGDVGTDVSFRPYVIEALKGKAYISDPSVSVITNKPSIFTSAPVRDSNNQVIAVVRSRLDLYGLWDLVEQAAQQSVPGTVAMLLDDHGIRIAHSASKGNREGVVKTLLYRAVAPLDPETTKQIVAEKRFGTATTERVNVLPLPQVAAAIKARAATTFEAAADNSTVSHQSASVPLQAMPWHLVLQAPDPSFTSAAVRMTQVTAAAAGLFALLIVLVAILIARGVTRPVMQLTEVADRISLGELSAKIEIERKDEIGDLAEALRRMQTSLQAAIERLRTRRTT